MPRSPNFFLIGAIKSGTTCLRKLLHANPDIFMCEPEFLRPQQGQQTEELGQMLGCSFLEWMTLSGSSVLIGECRQIFPTSQAAYNS